ncbi:hypothetical protein [Mycoplasmopsis gallinacea]|uniref:Uncharacterized protein n=1 Tax=Mycoplasmopsis gallinacea TaxID=29556 RepID=A0A6H0V3Q7_9BACT|nr:hypothetical protein [Mycoplasmopsis gallinacea]QIW62618.1 hypothetical protein GOQ20_04385 [Mycoplasmopsis gallinacea]
MTPEKIKKYLNMVIFIFLSIVLIGIFFGYTGQFGDKNNDGKNIGSILDILVPDLTRSIEWLAVATLAIGWIGWEFARSKTGKRLYAYISLPLILTASVSSMTLLGFIGGGLAIVLILVYTFQFIEPSKKETLVNTINDAAKANQKNNKKFLKIFSRGK